MLHLDAIVSETKMLVSDGEHLPMCWLHYFLLYMVFFKAPKNITKQVTIVTILHRQRKFNQSVIHRAVWLNHNRARTELDMSDSFYFPMPHHATNRVFRIKQMP